MRTEFGNTWKQIRSIFIAGLVIGAVAAVAIGAMTVKLFQAKQQSTTEL